MNAQDIVQMYNHKPIARVSSNRDGGRLYVHIRYQDGTGICVVHYHDGGESITYVAR